MILSIDVGNSETALGLFAGERLRHTWRISTDTRRTADEWGVVLDGLVRGAGEEACAVSGACIASVVPAVGEALEHALGSRFGDAVRSVDSTTPLSIRLDVDEPSQVGSDRIVNTLAAHRIFDRDVLIVDLGTATTFDCVGREGVFLGGVIMPGVRTSAERLTERTARLPRVGFEVPERVIGRNTEACIQSGVFFGAVSAIDGVVHRILDEWRADDPVVVATGGFAAAIGAHCETVGQVRPELTLEGIRMAYEELETGA